MFAVDCILTISCATSSGTVQRGTVLGTKKQASIGLREFREEPAGYILIATIIDGCVRLWLFFIFARCCSCWCCLRYCWRSLMLDQNTMHSNEMLCNGLVRSTASVRWAASTVILIYSSVSLRLLVIVIHDDQIMRLNYSRMPVHKSLYISSVVECR